MNPCRWSPLLHFSLWMSLTQIVYSLPGPRNSSIQPHIHPLAGTWPLTPLHLPAHSKVLQGIQQSTCKVYGHGQHMFIQFCHCYGLLPIPADQETLLYFATFLADVKGLLHGTIFSYLYRVWVLHIDMGLSDPLKGALQLHKCLWAIHIQSNLESHKLAFMYNLLVLAHPLLKFPAQQVLWAALTMAHFNLLWTDKFAVDQECFNPTWHLCIQDMTPNLTTQSELWYITIHLKISKTGPFGQGIDVIIGCSSTQICGACAMWDLIQSHQVKWASPTAPSFLLSGWLLSRHVTVGHAPASITFNYSCPYPVKNKF